MKNEDSIKKNHSILSLCIFRTICGRQALLQALALEKKRNLKVIDTETVPSQTYAETND